MQTPNRSNVKRGNVEFASVDFEQSRELCKSARGVFRGCGRNRNESGNFTNVWRNSSSSISGSTSSRSEMQ